MVGSVPSNNQMRRPDKRHDRAPVTKASKSSYRGHQRSRNGSSALRGFRKLSLNMPRHPLRSVVWDTGFVTVPRRGWPPNPAVTYPDVSGTSNKFKSFGFASRSLLVAAQGRDWRCVNFWKLWLPPPFNVGIVAIAHAALQLRRRATVIKAAQTAQERPAASLALVLNLPQPAMWTQRGSRHGASTAVSWPQSAPKPRRLNPLPANGRGHSAAA
jgi:hypothetical protein